MQKGILNEIYLHVCKYLWPFKKSLTNMGLKCHLDNKIDYFILYTIKSANRINSNCVVKTKCSPWPQDQGQRLHNYVHDTSIAGLV